jgi:hypothetical protein
MERMVELRFRMEQPEAERPREDWSTREHNWLRISPLHYAARVGVETRAQRDCGATLTQPAANGHQPSAAISRQPSATLWRILN